VSLRRFVSDDCEMAEFDPLWFLSLIKGQEVVLLGDSLTMQFFVALVCSLHGAAPTAARYKIDWAGIADRFGANDCPADNVHCYVGGGTVFYPDYNASITLYQFPNWVPSYSLAQHFEPGKPGRGDIIVINFGLHYDNPEKLEADVLRLAKEYSDIPVEDRPFLLWRETSPQHFGSDGFYTDPTTKCAPTTGLTDPAHVRHFRVDVPDRIFPSYKVPILRTYKAGSTEWWTHVGKQVDRVDGEAGRHDCTHFCEPSGVILHWRELFFNALLVASQQ
ncbi:unnamed protein product, partial [Phaeothamnion confervicola]